MKRLTLIVFSIFFVANTFAQTTDDLNNYNEPPSRFRGVIEKFSEDYGSLNRFYTAQTSRKSGGAVSGVLRGLVGVIESTEI